MKKNVFILSSLLLLALSSCSNNTKPYSNEKYYKLIVGMHSGYSSSYIMINEGSQYLLFNKDRMTYHYSSNLQYEYLYKTSNSLVYVSNAYNQIVM